MFLTYAYLSSGLVSSRQPVQLQTSSDPRMPPLKAPLHKILSAGIVVVHFDGERYRLLAVRRAFNNWSFPRAPVADGEDPLQVRDPRDARNRPDLD